MKLLDLLPHVDAQIKINLSYLDDDCECRTCFIGEKPDLIDSILDQGQNMEGLTVVSVDAGVYYFDEYDLTDQGEPELLITVDGWKGE